MHYKSPLVTKSNNCAADNTVFDLWLNLDMKAWSFWRSYISQRPEAAGLLWALGPPLLPS